MAPVLQRPHADWVRLSRAQLCLDCEAISDVSQPRCPACASGAFMTLAPKFAGEKTPAKTKAVPHV